MDTRAFTNLLDHALAVNRDMRKAHVEHRQYLSATQYAREFCTVQLDIGRAVGKSTYIAQHAEPSDMVICSNYNSMWHFERITLGYRAKFELATLDNFRNPERFRGRRQSDLRRTIWIDDASYATERDLAIIYETLAGHPSQTFVLLG